MKNTVENCRYLPEGSPLLACSAITANNSGIFGDNSETVAEVPKWPRFDVPVLNVEPTTEGKEVGLSHLDATGLALC